MRISNLKTFLSILLLTSLLASCDKDSAIEAGKYDTGVFVLNQGKFPDGNSAVTYIKDASSVPDIFSLENANATLGNVAQGMTFNNGKAYISINNVATVTIADAATFKKIVDIKNISLPRYFANFGDKVLLSTWGKTGSDGSIISIDKTSATTTVITTSRSPEKMLVDGNTLHVCMGNGYDVDSLLRSYDLRTNTLLKEYKIGKGPNSLVLDKNNALWVLCEGYFDWVKNVAYKSSLYKISNNTAVKVADFPSGSTDLNINGAKDKLFYANGKEIFSFDIAATSPMKLNVPLSVATIYGLTLDQKNNVLYASNPKDFASQGEVVKIDLSTLNIKSFPASVVPAQIVIR
jgi:hypothetical protein